MFEGKLALITGGAGGIGRATAAGILRHGGRVVLADLDLKAAEAASNELDNSGTRVLPLQVNVADSKSVNTMVARTMETFGAVDILLHCAGILARKPVVDMSDEEWHRIIAVDLDGTFYVTRAVARVMAPAGKGTMILMASDRGLYGAENRSHYAAAKGGLIAYMKSLALELGSRQVTVNAINPGRTAGTHISGRTAEDTAQGVAYDPLGKMSTPEQIAELVLFLAGAGGKFMTGQLVTVRMRIGGDQLVVRTTDG